MPDTTLAKPTADPQSVVQHEAAARIAWCRERIAEFGYEPLPTPQVWAGRDDIIAKMAEAFGIDRMDAAQAVDAAANEYWNPTATEDKSVAKRLSRQRLMLVRKRILDVMKSGRSDIQYKWEKNDAGELVRVPFKEKLYHDTPAALFALLIQVESTIMKLDGLDGVDTADGAAAVLDELDKAIDEADAQVPGIRQKVKLSLAQRIKAEKITELTGDGLRRLVAAMQEQAGGGAKKVESKVVQ